MWSTIVDSVSKCTYLLDGEKRFLFMNQELFSDIQAKFKGFLTGKLHPDVKKEALKEEQIPTPKPTFKVEKIEETVTFDLGNDNNAVGYRITYIDKNGNTRTKLSATPGYVK